MVLPCTCRASYMCLGLVGHGRCRCWFDEFLGTLQQLDKHLRRCGVFYSALGIASRNRAAQRGLWFSKGVALSLAVV